MIDTNFVKLMENTEKEAKQFFERQVSLDTPEKLIQMASFVGMFDRTDIDTDLFKHLMKKYTAIGY